MSGLVFVVLIQLSIDFALWALNEFTSRISCSAPESLYCLPWSNIATILQLLVGVSINVYMTYRLLWHYHYGTIRECLTVAAVASLPAGIAIVLFLVPTTFKRLTAKHCIALIVLALYCLISYCVAMGDVFSQKKRNAQYEHRLFIAPDAVGGVKELGINFPHDTMTEPLHLLYSGDRVYVIGLPNGKTALISKDKVWGAVAVH